MSSKSALSRGKEIRLQVFHKMADLGRWVAPSAVEAVENFVEVVDNFLYPNLYPELWKPIPAGVRRRNVLEIHVPARGGRTTFLEGIQSV